MMQPLRDCGFHAKGARRLRRAFTLVELLLALVLSAVVTGVAAVIVVQSARMRAVSEAELLSRWARVELFDVFARDVEGMLLSAGDPWELMEVSEEEGRLIEIVTLADAPSGDSMFRRRYPARIAYVLEESKKDFDAKILVREVRFLTDPEESVHRMALGRRLENAYVEFYNGTEWYPNTERENAGEETMAVRMTCVWWNTRNEPVRRTVPLAPVGGRTALSDWRN